MTLFDLLMMIFCLIIGPFIFIVTYGTIEMIDILSKQGITRSVGRVMDLFYKEKEEKTEWPRLD